jgi:hypothetical protein
MGSGTANTLGTPDDTGESTAGTTDGPPSTGTATVDPSDPTTTGPLDDTTTDEPPPVTTGDRTPLLMLSDGPTYDFGDVDTDQAVAHVFTLTNAGDAEATGLSATVAAPFGFSGGFPGAAGDCDDALAAGQSCAIEVTFAPTALGRHLATLAVTHDTGPDVTRNLAGGAIGETENLVVNAGGEATGAPPPGWTEVLGAWEADAYVLETLPFAGDAYLLSGAGPNNQDLSLRQSIDLDAWATTADAGRLRISFSGRARAYATDDDEHRIRIHYYDSTGATLQVWTSNYDSQDAWTQYSDERLAPAGTRTLQVELNCRKDSGTHCYAYFDALELRASYP